MAKDLKSRKFWNWARDSDDTETASPARVAERTLYINGVIAENGTWFDDDITPAMFRAELYGADGSEKSPVTLWLDSPGGDVFAAAEIYNALKEYKGAVTVKIGSIAASAASVIAMAGDKVFISPVGCLMIHNPSTLAMGDSAEMRRAAEMLDSVKDSIINAYETRTNLSRKEISKMMDSVKFMDAHEAQDLGFVDGLLFAPQVADTEIAAQGALVAVFNRPANIDKITQSLPQPEPPEVPAIQGNPVADYYNKLSQIKGGF